MTLLPAKFNCNNKWNCNNCLLLGIIIIFCFGCCLCAFVFYVIDWSKYMPAWQQSSFCVFCDAYKQLLRSTFRVSWSSAWWASEDRSCQNPLGKNPVSWWDVRLGTNRKTLGNWGFDFQCVSQSRYGTTPREYINNFSFSLNYKVEYLELVLWTLKVLL